MIRRILLIAVWCLPAIAGFSQATLSGKVTNGKGEPLSGATLQVRSKGFNKSTTTNEEGRFYFSGLLRGTYAVTAGHIGYETFSEMIAISDADSAIII
ncbi:MAG TPA: carboxypeptidase-like regulatory domain-containing protein, partial [Chitinophagaceae bacterium]|nr:carboxypeptidase-like regulatory domain-containing protein [Chitinophagaceae bacterium]